MFFFERYVSMFGFAILWGLIITTDFILRLSGQAGTYGIQTGVVFPYAAPIMSGLVILAFIYFLISPSRTLSKKFYASCNYMMLIVLTVVLLVDFILRFVAFD